MKLYPNVAFAVGGLAGNNAHGAGFLQGALDKGVKPAIISCTSGQILWVSKFLEHMDHPERFEMYFDEKLEELKPLRLWWDGLAELLGDGPVPAAQTNLWRSLAHLPWPFSAMMANLPWRDVAWQSLLKNKLGDLFILGDMTNTTPGTWLKPDFPDEFFNGISKQFNSEHETGIVFNSYDPVSGLERIHLNEKARELLNREYSPPGQTRGSYRERLRYDPIDPQAVKEALWLYLYGFEEGFTYLDGAYYREVILSEVCGDEIDTIYVARPISQKWQEALPKTFIEGKDLETEVAFNGSYRGERDKIDLVNKFARQLAVLEKKLGSLYPEVEPHIKDLFKFHQIQLIELEIRRQRGFFDYVFEDKPTFDEAREAAKGRLPPADRHTVQSASDA
jgi:hypothetical protein